MANYTDWRRGTLARLNAPQSPENLQFLQDWNQREGGHFNNSATYNWLNTTRGDQFPAINSHNVRAYPDFQTGVDSTAQTLMLPHYQKILGLLRAGQGTQVWDQAPDELAKWGTIAPQQMPGQLPVVDAKAAGLEGMLANAIAAWEKGSAGILGQTQDAMKQAQSQQQDLFGQMQQNVDQPAPENDPKAEFFTRLMGNISQVLAPGLNGQKQAEQTIQEPLDNIQQQRAKNFQLLAMKHEEAARRAERLGDKEGALKYYMGVEKNLKQAELYSGLIKNRDDNASKERIAAAERLRKGGGGGGGSKGSKGGSRGDKLRAHANSLEADLLKGSIEDKREAQRLITRYRAEADAFDAVDMPDTKAPTGVAAQYASKLQEHIKALGRPVSQKELLAELRDPKTQRDLAAKGMTVEEAKAVIAGLHLTDQPSGGRAAAPTEAALPWAPTPPSKWDSIMRYWGSPTHGQ